MKISGLYKEIIENGGCVISEYKPNTIAKKEYFPQRNRIVSGLSLGTLVIEATYRSGTSITAQFAINQGRKLFCIPNSIGNKNSAGIINLLKKGAKLITNADEILYELGLKNTIYNYEKNEEERKRIIIKEKEFNELKDLDNITKNIYFIIKENVVINSETLVNELNLSIQEINVHLTILELKGLIVNKVGTNFRIRDELYV